MSTFLGCSLSPLWCRLAFPFCPALLHRRRYTLTGCRAHTATFRAARGLSLAPIARTTTPCRLGIKSHESCNCVLDTTSFLPKVCHYALNVHVFPFLIAITAPAVQPVNGTTPFWLELTERLVVRMAKENPGNRQRQRCEEIMRPETKPFQSV